MPAKYRRIDSQARKELSCETTSFARNPSKELAVGTSAQYTNLRPTTNLINQCEKDPQTLEYPEAMTPIIDTVVYLHTEHSLPFDGTIPGRSPQDHLFISSVRVVV